MSTGDAVGAETTGLVASAAKAQAHSNSAPRRAETPLDVPALAKVARLFPGTTRNHTISVITPGGEQGFRDEHKGIRTRLCNITIIKWLPYTAVNHQGTATRPSRPFMMLSLVNWSRCALLINSLAGGSAVPGYRIYRLDGDGRFSTADWIDAEDDVSALSAARSAMKERPFELWHGARLVAREDPAAPAADRH